ncbi:MAG: ATP-binding cassette domain-containing protein, partial [Staphylococcus epidermidis]|nr:ATP-binding cassette domain-containing protein [Staphylococcus epidermidis]
MKSRIHFSIDRDLICAIMVGVLGGIIALAMFFLSGYMITQSALGTPLYALMILVVSVKLFGFLRAITRYIERLLSHKTTFTMLRNVRVQFLKMLYPVVPDIYRRFNSSDLITKMISRVEALQNIYLRVYYPPIVIGLTAIVSVITMLFLSPLHALVITLSMLLTLWIVPCLSAKKARKLKQQVTQTQKIFLKRYYDYKEGHEELKRFNRSDDFKNTVSHALRQFDDMQLKERRFLSIYDYLLNLIAMFSIFMCLVLGAQQIHDGQLNAIYITSIILMILTLFEQAVPMSNVAYYKADTDQALEEIHEVIVPKYKIPSEHTNLKRSQNVLLEIKNVTFKYEHQYHSILKQINLTFEYGDKVAIIGPSGSGKSTLLHVLLGLFQIEEGKVILNGKDMNSINDNEKYQT